MSDLQGKTLLISGGSRGIGLAIAVKAAADGANVALVAKTAEPHPKLEGTIFTAAKAIEEAGGQALPIVGDVRDDASVEAAVEATVERFGGIDIVVNNAANALAQPLGQFTPEAWDKSFEVNLRGPVFLVQAALPHLRASRHASVINLVSVGAFMFAANTALYSAAKSALVSFTRSMAAAYVADGIRVNALAPGNVDTDMMRNAGGDFQAGARAATLQRRISAADEMVGPALLLASDAGSFITGQVLVVDGGMFPY
jgi:NAD(P)-dependent dehydrogenase (short-subunit alcohol dehydrogenase family)